MRVLVAYYPCQNSDYCQLSIVYNPDEYQEIYAESKANWFEIFDLPFKWMVKSKQGHYFILFDTEEKARLFVRKAPQEWLPCDIKQVPVLDEIAEKIAALGSIA